MAGQDIDPAADKVVDPVAVEEFGDPDVNRAFERYRGKYPIVVKDLKNCFGEQVVHEGLSLEVNRGEIIGVVGGSGTGKSVLMRSIIGLQTPDEGEIEVFGRSITRGNPEDVVGVRNRWGVLFQGGALFSTLTVGENVEVPLKQFYPDIHPALTREIARYKIMLSGLPEEAVAKYPSELSGGEMQRVAIGRAIVHRPPVLLTDEPTGNLDPETSDQVFGALMTLVRETGLVAGPVPT